MDTANIREIHYKVYMSVSVKKIPPFLANFDDEKDQYLNQEKLIQLIQRMKASAENWKPSLEREAVLGFADVMLDEASKPLPQGDVNKLH